MFIVVVAAVLSCPGHGGIFHARGEMVVTFQDSCARVSKEVQSRIQGAGAIASLRVENSSPLLDIAPPSTTRSPASVPTATTHPPTLM
jgi:hypothetical protein